MARPKKTAAAALELSAAELPPGTWERIRNALRHAGDAGALAELDEALAEPAAAPPAAAPTPAAPPASPLASEPEQGSIPGA